MKRFHIYFISNISEEKYLSDCEKILAAVLMDMRAETLLSTKLHRYGINESICFFNKRVYASWQ
jgi:hypothetical protein